MTDLQRASAVRTQGSALVAVVGLAVLTRADLDLSDWYPFKASALFAMITLLVLGCVRQHHPFERFGAANTVTTARAVLVVLVAAFIGERAAPEVAATAAVVSLVATLLDGVDGWLARRTRRASAFGSRFDLETDALLILVLAILAWQYGKAGRWVLASGLLRYAFVGAGWVWPWMRRPLTPSLRGRVICVVQIVALVLAVVPVVTPPASAVVAGLGLAALGYSFLVDTWWLWRQRPSLDTAT